MHLSRQNEPEPTPDETRNPEISPYPERIFDRFEEAVDGRHVSSVAAPRINTGLDPLPVPHERARPCRDDASAGMKYER